MLSGLEPVEVVEETAEVVAFHHTRPSFVDAHVVVVPKAHVPSLLAPEAEAVLPAVFAVVRRVAGDVVARCGAARVVTNLGAYQDSSHLHWHVCAGDRVADVVPRPPSGTERHVRPLGR